MGAVLGEMLSGQLPEGSIPDLHVKNPEVPHTLEGLYRKALNQNPNARFKTPAEMFAEIADVARKTAPPLSRPRVETSPALPLASRPRPTGGMLQLSTARSRPPPPVPEMPPPPPPPLTGESEVGSRDNPADATVPLDSVQVKASLSRPTRPEQRVVAAPPAPDPREDTEVIDSGQFLNDDSKSQLNETGTRESLISNPSTMWLLGGLIVVGLLLGGGGGYFVVQMRNAHETSDSKAPDVVPTDKLDAQKWEAEKAERERAAAEALRLETQKAANDKAASDKAAADQAAADKTLADKQMAAKAAVDKAAFDKAAADKAAAKAAADKAAEEKLATEKVKAAAEKEAADKAAAEKAAFDKKKQGETTVAAVTSAAAGSDGSCAEGMRPVAAGSFKMGTAKDDEMLNFDEKTLESVEVPAFCIDLFEFPNKRGVTPTVNVSWSDAKRLCEGRGKRLCTEPEWEKACKGPGNARWPYGSTFDANACNTEDDVGDDRAIAPSGRFAKCRSGYGVADLSGNIAEWTQEKQQKGGAFSKPDYAVRCSARKLVTSGAKASDVGFRCCTDLKQ
ncbi:MAG: SUMF1/EgtB/PvdO family nonheme iron enzyme [Myxococcaceae bacterium]|nr:SUMF1/EgtB/PvdO family nonheme iron enzyme [Myxococcaceae bacterium]